MEELMYAFVSSMVCKFKTVTRDEILPVQTVHIHMKKLSVLILIF